MRPSPLGYGGRSLTNRIGIDNVKPILANVVSETIKWHIKTFWPSWTRLLRRSSRPHDLADLAE
jgi:hypothetical protein